MPHEGYDAENHAFILDQKFSTASLQYYQSNGQDIFKIAEEYEGICTRQVQEAMEGAKSSFPSSLNSLWREEGHIWNLLRLVFEEDHRIQTRQTHSIAQPSTDRIEMVVDDERKLPVWPCEWDVCQKLLQENVRLRRWVIYRQWLEGIAKESLEVVAVDGSWRYTRQLGQVTMDTPAAALTPEDRAREQDVLRMCLSLLRAGNLEEAIRYLDECGQPWRAAALAGNLRHQRDAVQNGVERGCSQRFLFRKTAAHLAGETNNMWEKAIFALSAGLLVPHALDVYASWKDKLWMELSVRVENVLDAAVGELLEEQARNLYAHAPSEFHDTHNSDGQAATPSRDNESCECRASTLFAEVMQDELTALVDVRERRQEMGSDWIELRDLFDQWLTKGGLSSSTSAASIPIPQQWGKQVHRPTWTMAYDNLQRLLLEGEMDAVLAFLESNPVGGVANAANAATGVAYGGYEREIEQERDVARLHWRRLGAHVSLFLRSLASPETGSYAQYWDSLILNYLAEMHLHLAYTIGEGQNSMALRLSVLSQVILPLCGVLSTSELALNQAAKLCAAILVDCRDVVAMNEILNAADALMLPAAELAERIFVLVEQAAASVEEEAAKWTMLCEGMRWISTNHTDPVEMLQSSNNLGRRLLLARAWSPCMFLYQEVIPANCPARIQEEWTRLPSDAIPMEEESVFREFMWLRSFLVAIYAFEQWRAMNAELASAQGSSSAAREGGNSESIIRQLSIDAQEKLLLVLKPPSGAPWCVEEFDLPMVEGDNRLAELKELRQIYLPDLIRCYRQLLLQDGDPAQCVQQVIALTSSPASGMMDVLSPEDTAELLMMIRQDMIAVLALGTSDAFGRRR